MSNSNNISKLIEQYLTGLMSESERLEFENQMLTDAALREEVEMELAIRETVFSANLGEVGQIIDRNFESAYQKTNSINWAKWGLTSVAILITASLIGYYSLQEKEEISQHEKEEISEKQFSVPKEEVITEVDSDIPGLIQREEKKSIVITHEGTKKDVPANNSEDIKVKETLVEEKIIQPALGEEDQKQFTESIQQNGEQAGERIDESPKEATIVCPASNQTADVKTKLANLEGEDGQIVVQGNYGLTGELNFEIQEVGQSQYSPKFNSLSEGEYTILVTDKNNCVVELSPVTLSKSSCSDKIEGAFSPHQGSGTWKLLLNDQLNAEIKINNENGEVYHQNSFGQSFIEWDGQNNVGDLSKMGLYFYEVRYENGEVCRGSVLVSY